jgi:hypothetical protein
MKVAREPQFGLFFVLLAVIMTGAGCCGYGLDLMASGSVEVGNKYFMVGAMIFTFSPLLLCLEDN